MSQNAAEPTNELQSSLKELKFLPWSGSTGDMAKIIKTVAEQLQEGVNKDLQALRAEEAAFDKALQAEEPTDYNALGGQYRRLQITSDIETLTKMMVPSLEVTTPDGRDVIKVVDYPSADIEEPSKVRALALEGRSYYLGGESRRVEVHFDTDGGRLLVSASTDRQWMESTFTRIKDLLAKRRSWWGFLNGKHGWLPRSLVGYLAAALIGWTLATSGLFGTGLAPQDVWILCAISGLVLGIPMALVVSSLFPAFSLTKPGEKSRSIKTLGFIGTSVLALGYNWISGLFF